jgi:hypothetical protein
MLVNLKVAIRFYYKRCARKLAQRQPRQLQCAARRRPSLGSEGTRARGPRQRGPQEQSREVARSKS